MCSNLGTFARLTVAVPLLLAFAGCGGTGNETVGTSPAAANPEKKEQASSPPAKNDSSEGGELTTPTRVVDPKRLVDVVEGDVKGGEAAKGGSPMSVLWLPPNEASIKDESFEVKIPKGLSPLVLNVNVPASNPLTKGKVDLGKQLYFDPRVSLDGSVSCATCHDPKKGWTDNLKTSIGIDGQRGGRNAPTVLNTVYGRTMFWDGRAPSLEGQAQGPVQNPIEMGKQSYEDIVKRLRKISGYQEQFQKVFGTEVTLDGMSKAIASFERSAALSGNSKYDKYNSDGDLKALSDSEKRGLVLFGLRLRGEDEFKPGVPPRKAECTACHAGSNFTDELFHNIGIGWDATKNDFADLGRFAISPIGAKNLAERGSFKTPTVRDVTRTGPYMHDGSVATLEEVVEHYNKGGHPNPELDKDVKKLNLTDSEKADVVAFMKALTSEAIEVPLPTLPVGPDGKTPDPADALNAPSPKSAMDAYHPSTVR